MDYLLRCAMILDAALRLAEAGRRLRSAVHPHDHARLLEHRP